jgi:hypothetical protein
MDGQLDLRASGDGRPAQRDGERDGFDARVVRQQPSPPLAGPGMVLAQVSNEGRT